MDDTTLPPEEGSTRTDETSDAYLAPGSRVAHYRIVELIGTGGMGVIYRARDTVLNRTVALKCPWREIAARPLSVKRFLREARTTAGLTHPHIVTVHEVFEHDGLPWLAMEYVDGHDLRQLLADKRVLPIRDLLHWGEQLANALANAHAGRVLHRDIKPANILISSNGDALLTDFGLARHLPQERENSESPTRSLSLTRPGVALGTPAYWSPEQAQRTALDERSDVFSLGAVMFEMCTGRRLSSIGGFEELQTGSQSLESRSIRRINRLIPGNVEEIVRKAVAPHPDDRYQSAAELALDLEQSRRAWEARRFLSRIPRKRPAAFSVAVVFLALAAAAVGWALMRQRPQAVHHPDLEVTSTALVTWPSLEVGARFSPDGRWVSFLSNHDGQFRVYVKSLDGQLEQAVTPREGMVTGHAWSDDGREIASLVRLGDSTFVRITPALGGPPRKTIPLGEELSGSLLNRWIGTHLYVESKSSSLHRIDTETGEATEVLAPSESGFRAQFDVRPDESRIVYMAGQGPQFALWTSDLDGGSARQVTSGEFSDNGARWVGPEWSSIVYSSNRTGQEDLWRVYLEDGFTTRITLSAAVETLTDVAADGSMLAFEQANQEMHLWTSSRETGSSRQLTSGTLSDFWPAVAGAAEVVAFQRTRPTLDNLASYQGGQILLGTLEPPGGIETELLVDNGYLPRLSADARWLAHARSSELWIQEIATGHASRVSESLWVSGVSQYPLAWTRDTFAWSGSFLYYVERIPLASSVHRVRTQGPAQPETVIPAEPDTIVLGIYPSHDGKTMAYVRGRRDSEELRLRDLESGEDRLLISVSGAALFTKGWFADDRSLLVISKASAAATEPLELFVVDRSGDVRPVGVIENGFIETTVLDADGNSLYVTISTDGLHNVHAISLADGSMRRITDNSIRGVTFSKVRRWTGDRLIYTRQQRNTDIWTIEFSGQEQE